MPSYLQLWKSLHHLCHPCPAHPLIGRGLLWPVYCFGLAAHWGWFLGGVWKGRGSTHGNPRIDKIVGNLETMGDPKFLYFLFFGDPKLPAEFPKPLELNFRHQNGRGWRVMRREAMLLSVKCSVASRCRGLSQAMMPTASAALHPDLSLPDTQRKTGCWPHCKMLVIHYKPYASLSKNALWQPPLPICYLRQVVDNPQVLHCRQCLVGGL